MTTNNNDTKHYSAEDISRYWQGKMSVQEMHALEEAAMDDPFLADALEGYSAADAQSIPGDVHELRQRLHERAIGEKVIPLKKDNKWWRVAAALILLFGAGGLAYKLFLQNDSRSQEIALVKEKDAPALTQQENTTSTGWDATTATKTKQTDGRFMNVYDSSVLAGDAQRGINASASAPKDQPAATFGNTDDAKTYNYKVNNRTEETKSLPNLSAPDLSAYKKKDSLSPGIVSFNSGAERKDSLFIASNDANKNVGPGLQRNAPVIQNAPANNQSEARMNRDRDVNNQFYINNFSGRVIDQNNNAIPFASVRVNNNTQVAAATNDGYFQVRSADTVLDLSITSVGYESRQLTLRGNQPTQEVILDRASPKKLESVTVNGNLQKKKSTKESPVALNVYVMDAQPLAGWDNYNDYLAKNKRVDSSYIALKGEVVVSFWVGKNGQLSSFSIEKSLDRTLDAEAIRLVKEGPAWKLTKGKKTRARAIVAF